MRYPVLSASGHVRQTLDAFGGYNHNLRIGENEFFRMENLSSDRSPVLSPRGKRGIWVKEKADGLIAKDSLCYISGGAFVMNGYRVELHLSEGEKQLISMGAYVIILPDKVWINTLDLTDHGNIEAVFTSASPVTFTLCAGDGTALPQPVSGPEAPQQPENGALWLDTSVSPGVLKVYSRDAGLWSAAEGTCVQLSCPGIGRAFRLDDGVTVSGVLPAALAELNGAHVILERGDDYIRIPGCISGQVVQEPEAGAVTVERRMPDMDFVTQCGNRLWGCRYGTDRDGRTVNELYACKLGDFCNWNCFLGLSTDSWAASVGSDGPFTGAVTHLDHPVFFKEHCLHKIYISPAGAHQVQDTPCRGVERGSGKSLAMVGETLFYKSPGGICAYDGSLPVEISRPLGNVHYHAAVGGAAGQKYYVSMADGSDDWHLFVYDMEKALWHREDSFHAAAFCCCRGELYAIAAETGWIWGMLGSGEPEPAVRWMAQTGQWGLATPDRKYISRLVLLMGLGTDTVADISICYDLSETWEHLCTLRGSGLGLTAVPVRPRRCGYFRLRLEGTGDARLYSITKTVEEGSDL